jgi:hypothetical protein
MTRPTSHRPWPRTLGGVVAALLFLPGGVAAQSVLSAYGFGTPLEPLNARALALGGIGMGLQGTVLAPHDPSASADLVLPAVVFTSQTTWHDTQEGDQLSSHTSTRFPAIGVMYPLEQIGTISLSFSGVLDQNWSVSQERVLTLEGSGTEARVTDLFDSEGGVSTLRLGVARRIAPSLAVGASVGTYIGNVTRRFARSFDSLEVETSVPAFQTGGVWDYSGFVASVGSTVDLSSVGRVSASISLGGDLKASPTSDSDGSGVTIGMPTEFRVGGSALLSEQFSLTAGVSYADYAGAGEALDEVEGEAVLRVGGGLEWSGASLLGKPSAIRLGYRSGDLPFHRTGDPGVSESAFVGGLGMNLLESESDVLARADLAIERGSRDAGLFTEDFWRLSVSLRVSGF